MTSSFEPDVRDVAEPEFVPDSQEMRPVFRPTEAAAPRPRAAAEGFTPANAVSVAADECAEVVVPETDSRASEAALADARREGLEAGRDAANEALSRPLLALASAAAQLEEQRSQYLGAQRELLIELALAIAGRIVQREIELDPGLLMRTLERALGSLDEGVPATVHLCASDYEVLEAPGLEALKQGRAAEVSFQARSDLAPGEARVVCGASTVDARIDAILKRVRAEFSRLTAESGEAEG